MSMACGRAKFEAASIENPGQFRASTKGTHLATFEPRPFRKTGLGRESGSRSMHGVGTSTSSRLLRCAARRFCAEFASRDQTRSHYVIHLSDAITQFESAVGDIADCSGSEG